MTYVATTLYAQKKHLGINGFKATVDSLNPLVPS